MENGTDGNFQMTFEIPEEDEQEMMNEDDDINASDLTKNNSADEFFNKVDYKKLLSEFFIPDGNQEEDKDDTPGISLLEKARNKMTDITAPYGYVYKQLIKQGTGPPIPQGALVVYHYTMYQEKDMDMGLEPFDCTFFRHKPDRQRLGNALIEGLEIAISSMKKGERSRFALDYRVMYGEKGVPPRIEAKSDILAEIEIVSFMERGKISSYFEKSEEEREMMTFEEVMAVAQEFIKRITESSQVVSLFDEKQLDYSRAAKDGKGQFQTHRYMAASRKYREAISIILTAPARSEAQENKKLREFAVGLTNAAISAFYSNNVKQTIKHCTNALDTLDRLSDADISNMSHKKAKVLYYYGKALRADGKYEEARKKLNEAYRLQPLGTDIKEELLKNEESIKQYRQVEKNMYRRMMNNHSKPTNKPEPTIDVDTLFGKNFKNDMLEFLKQPNPVFSRMEKSSFNEMELKVMKKIVRDLDLSFIEIDSDIQIRKKMT